MKTKIGLVLFIGVVLLVFILGIFASEQKFGDKEEVERTDGDTYDTKLIILRVNGESHEFVNYSVGKYNNGIAHWPGCKYCKNKN